MIRPTAVLLLAAAGLGGCSWLYDSPYDYALYSEQPVPPPPTSTAFDDVEALLPYDVSPHFGGDVLAIEDYPDVTGVEEYYDPEDTEIR